MKVAKNLEITEEFLNAEVRQKEANASRGIQMNIKNKIMAIQKNK